MYVAKKLNANYFILTSQENCQKSQVIYRIPTEIIIRFIRIKIFQKNIQLTNLNTIHKVFKTEYQWKKALITDGGYKHG